MFSFHSIQSSQAMIPQAHTSTDAPQQINNATSSTPAELLACVRTSHTTPCADKHHTTHQHPTQHTPIRSIKQCMHRLLPHRWCLCQQMLMPPPLTLLGNKHSSNTQHVHTSATVCSTNNPHCHTNTHTTPRLTAPTPSPQSTSTRGA